MKRSAEVKVVQPQSTVSLLRPLSRSLSLWSFTLWWQVEVSLAALSSMSLLRLSDKRHFISTKGLSMPGSSLDRRDFLWPNADSSSATRGTWPFHGETEGLRVALATVAPRLFPQCNVSHRSEPPCLLTHRAFHGNYLCDVLLDIKPCCT